MFSKDDTRTRSITFCMIFFAICACARVAEYFLIRTDETFLSENFIHKVFGIAALAIILRARRIKPGAIGFTKDAPALWICKGLLLGTFCFAIAYAAECLILRAMNGSVHMELYASGFSLSNGTVKQTGIVFVLLCVVMNIINVWMEEGVFRGLFTHTLSGESFWKSTLIIAALFGVWHWVMPIRDCVSGRMTIAGCAGMAAGYMILAGIMSVKWSLLYKMTGSLWMGIGDHLFNNVVVTNLLHVVSGGEADHLQIVRIIIGQILSFIIVARVAKYKLSRRQS